MPRIDLNADLGEGFGVWRLGDDDAMLGIVTSANVACGFHAGDPAGLVRVCRSAAERGVRIGAQVSYRDLAGFGRRFIDVAAEDLLADVVYQIGALQAIAQAAGSAVSLRQTPWRAVQHDRDQPRAGRRRGGGGAPGGRRAAGAGHGGFGVLRRGRPPRIAHGGRSIRRPRIPARRRSWFPAANRARCCTIRSRSRSGWRPW